MSRRERVGTALSSQPVLVLLDPAGGLQRLELIVSPHASGAEGVQATMDARTGTMSAPLRAIRAGSFLKIAATGSYRVGDFYDAC